MIGQTVGHYEILDRLGAGGMGEVYRAEDTTLKRQVALKVLPPEVAGSQERLKRFRREAELVASLSHPNIVVIHSVEQAGGIHFLTMELVEGKPLSTYIPPDGLPLDSYFEIAVPLADALSAAHENGVIHRDLKPDNIMVSDRGVVKVLDFGLAKLASPEKPSDSTSLPTETLTNQGRIQGTVPYMSPEQVRGREIDHQSDIFSLGVVLHEMATGQRLFHGESSADTVSAILTTEPEPVSEVRPDLPFHLSRIISHCLVKDQTHRYRSTQDVRDELEGLRREVETGHVRTGTLAAQVIEKGRVPRTWSWKIAAVVALTLVIAALYYYLKPPAAASGYNAVAVLPFENLTGDPSQSYVGDGLSAGLISQLSEVRGLSVVGRSEAWSLRGLNLSARQIGRRLGVEMVVDGELLPGDKLRADLNLTDARTGLILWSDSFEGDRERLFELQKEMTRRLTQYLAIPLSLGERRRLARDPTTSAKAYDFYMQGQQFLEDVDTFQGPEFARDLFRQAIRVDPQFALAHVGSSDALWRIYQRDRDWAALEEAEKEAERALEIDPELPAAQVALSRVYRSTGRYAESIGQLRQILAEHPSPAEAYRQLAFSYEAYGDLESAEESLRFAIALRNEDWFAWNTLGAFFVRTGNSPEARGAFERAAELAPEGLTWPRENLAAVRILEGDFNGAIEAFEQIEAEPDDPQLIANIGTAYFFVNRLEEAEKYYKLAVKLSPRSPIEHGNLADLYVRQGRDLEARESYRMALRLVEEALLNNPKDNDLRVNQTLYAAKAGECDMAIQLADTLRDKLPRTGGYAHDRAVAYSLCGQRESTLGAIREAIELGISPDLIREEDEFRTLSDDPGFLGLVGESPTDASF